jgi:hypothetical protein
VEGHLGLKAHAEKKLVYPESSLPFSQINAFFFSVVQQPLVAQRLFITEA